MTTKAELAARMAEKEAQRRANIEKWRDSPLNANNRYKQVLDTLAPGLAADEAPVEPDERTGSRSLAKLRKVMADVNTPLFRRLDCCEVIIGYELAPGSIAGASDPNAIEAGSYRFLISAADDPRTPEALRFRCLKLLVALENQRARNTNTAIENEEKHRLLIALVNAEYGRKWQAAVESGSCTLNIGNVWPDGWPGQWQWPPSSFAEALGHPPKVGDMFKAELLRMAETSSAIKPQKD